MKDNLEALLEQRDVLLKKLLEAPLWINGSVVESVRKQRGKEAPFYYLSQSVKGKNKITYISARHLDDFKTAADAGLKFRELLSELSTINIKLIKAGYNK